MRTSASYYVSPGTLACYELPIIDWQEPRRFAELLLTVDGIEWIWRAEYDGENILSNTEVCILSEDTIKDLVEALTWGDEFQVGCLVMLFGYSRPRTGEASLRDLKDKARRFSAGDASGLETVILQMEDGTQQLVFVGQPPSELAKNFLSQLEVENSLVKRRAYRDLGVATLETQMDL